jgi:hypothetical protein
LRLTKFHHFKQTEDARHQISVQRLLLLHIRTWWYIYKCVYSKEWLQLDMGSWLGYCCQFIQLSICLSYEKLK